MTRPGGKPTIKDVAIEAGVSLGTASRVVNQYPDVNAELKRRVELAIAKLGYTPNLLAQSMRSRSTRSIGILIRDFSAPAFADFAMAAQGLLFENGYVPLLAGYSDDPRRELQILQAFAQRQIDGMIVTTSNDSNPDLMNARRQLHVPTILFDRDPDKGQDAIAIDHRQGILDAGAYLHHLGHRRIALVTGQREVRPARERIAAFEEFHARAGLSLDPELVCAGSFSEDVAQQQVMRLLGLRNRPTAIIGGGVNMLPGLLRGIRACGLSMPGDVSLICSTNSELAELVTPSITELRVDYERIGREAAVTMMGRLDGSIKGPTRMIQTGTRLIVRESCASPPAKSRPRTRKTA